MMDCTQRSWFAASNHRMQNHGSLRRIATIKEIMPTSKPTASTGSKHSMTEIERALALQSGARLVTVRNHFGHTQGTMATILGIALPTLKGYERGRSCPSCGALLVLASMGINLHWLITGIGNMQSAQGANRLSPEERTKLYLCIEEVYRLNESLGLGMPLSKQAGMAARFFSEWMESQSSSSRAEQKDVFASCGHQTPSPEVAADGDRGRQPDGH